MEKQRGVLEDLEGLIMDNGKIKARRWLAIFFILMGLVISIGGVCGCLINKHYIGEIKNYEQELVFPDSPTSKVVAMYPANVGNIGSTLYYDFQRHDFGTLEGLSYTINVKWLWLNVVAGLLYIWLGIHAIRNKDFLFK